MRSSLFAFLLAGVFAWSVGLPAEDSAPSSPGQPIPVPAQPTSPAQPIPAQQGSSTPDSASQPRNPNLEAPRSDSVNADALPSGESSSKDTAIDLSPPANDVKAHPESSDILKDAVSAPSHGDVSEFHPWNPHKAAKDVEVGDFYFKRKNYRAAEDRYREALFYKDNDAIATFRLAVCLEKMDQPDEALKEFESYLKILPHGPQAQDARKAIDRLKGSAASAKTAQ